MDSTSFNLSNASLSSGLSLFFSELIHLSYRKRNKDVIIVKNITNTKKSNSNDNGIPKPKEINCK